MTTRNIGFQIYDVLFGRDEQMNPKPQMLAGYVIEDDGKRWVMTLRENQWFHDGEKVLARDCVASLRRWMVRDPAGATICRLGSTRWRRRTIARSCLRLNRKLPHRCRRRCRSFRPRRSMVPERLAKTDPFRSRCRKRSAAGRFRFLADEYVIGSHAALVPFERYVPRDEKPSFTSGGHKVLVDRMEWKMIPDASTAANALVTGEIDWLEMPMPDLLPVLRAAPNVKVGRLDDYGFISQLRPNHVITPTNNVKIRRAIRAAISQREVMDAVMGGDPDSAIVPMGYLATGNPDVDMAGMEEITKKRSPAEIKALFADAGYHGETLVMLHTTDQPFYNLATLVVLDSLKRAGVNGRGSGDGLGLTLQRRSSEEPLDKGGWSLFVSVTPVPEYRDPLLGSLLRGNGKDAWIGWPEIPAMETAYNAWLDADTQAEQTALERKIQLIAVDRVPFIPLGPLSAQGGVEQIDQRSRERARADILWNVSKS